MAHQAAGDKLQVDEDHRVQRGAAKWQRRTNKVGLASACNGRENHDAEHELSKATVK